MIDTMLPNKSRHMKNKSRGADKIISTISTQLSNKTLQGGDRLPSEAKLCEQFNVSRTVVREAIQQLKAIGVVYTVTGSGSYITAGDLNGLKSSLEFYMTMTGDTASWLELLELRIILESACARKLAGDNFSKVGLNQLKKALKKQAENQDDIDMFSRLDVDFHHILIRHSRNKIVSAVLLSLEDLQTKFSSETYNSLDSKYLTKRNLQEHYKIVQAIEARDPDLAEAAMIAHLSETKKSLESYIAKKSQ